jgi:hypothetical protein
MRKRSPSVASLRSAGKLAPRAPSATSTEGFCDTSAGQLSGGVQSDLPRGDHRELDDSGELETPIWGAVPIPDWALGIRGQRCFVAGLPERKALGAGLRARPLSRTYVDDFSGVNHLLSRCSGVLQSGRNFVGLKGSAQSQPGVVGQSYGRPAPFCWRWKVSTSTPWARAENLLEILCKTRRQ